MLRKAGADVRSKKARVDPPMVQSVVHAKGIETPKVSKGGGEAPVPELPSTQITPVHFDAIDTRVPAALRPIQDALSAHWSFLYRRADPALQATESGVEFTKKRTEVNDKGVQAGLAALEKKGVNPAEEKVVVFGGGYEVDLGPLLDRFKEVHVVDLCADPLALATRKYAGHPHRDRLKLITADASGIPAAIQAAEIERVKAEVRGAGAPSIDGLADYFAKLPNKLDKLPFESGTYAMVVSPVLHESLPFGTATVAFEEARMKASEKAGSDVGRQAIDSHVGESFYYRPAVRDGVKKVFQHNRDELQRMTKAKGVCVFSSWMRKDEHQETLAPGERQQLVRVGDSRMSEGDWQSMFSGWKSTASLHSEQIYPGKKPTLNLFLLEADDIAKAADKGPTSRRVDLHKMRFGSM